MRFFLALPGLKSGARQMQEYTLVLAENGGPGARAPGCPKPEQRLLLFRKTACPRTRLAVDIACSGGCSDPAKQWLNTPA